MLCFFEVKNIEVKNIEVKKHNILNLVQLYSTQVNELAPRYLSEFLIDGPVSGPVIYY
jgi:hypothetical protein